MELDRGAIIAGVLIALGLGAGLAWWSQADRVEHGAAAERAAFATKASDSATAEKPPSLYKWQDDNGVWTYTDQPPTDREFEVIRGTPRVTNVPTVVPDVPRSPQSKEIPPPSD